MRNVAMELESASRIMHANILLVHQSRPINGNRSFFTPFVNCVFCYIFFLLLSILNVTIRIVGIFLCIFCVFLLVFIDVLEKAKSQIGVLKDLYSQLAGILRECPGQYYR